MKHRNLPAYLIGLCGSLSIILFYFTVMLFASDWQSAVDQFKEFLWWIVALSAGLGIQLTLFVRMRRQLRGVEKTAAGSVLAASGGVSTVSMIACCLHHLTDIVPILGFPVIAAFLQRYQTVFFMTAVFFNLAGIFMLLRAMAKHGLIKTGRESVLTLLRSGPVS